jgi:hypothetical protein
MVSRYPVCGGIDCQIMSIDVLVFFSHVVDILMVVNIVDGELESRGLVWAQFLFP